MDEFEQYNNCDCGDGTCKACNKNKTRNVLSPLWEKTTSQKKEKQSSLQIMADTETKKLVVTSVVGGASAISSVQLVVPDSFKMGPFRRAGKC